MAAKKVVSVVGKKVVVTTAHRGVFFGTLTSRDGDEVTLADARVCVYWSTKTKGFIGLAATGPLGGSRVSESCESLTITSVTSISLCSDEAAKRWESAPWN